MKCFQTFVVVMSIVVIHLFGAQALAVNHYVNISTPSPCGVNHTSIQDGINHAVSGDYVVVGPGVYVEQLTISKNYITVRSLSGANVTTIDPPELFPGGIEILGNNNSFRGFTVRDLTVGHNHAHRLIFVRGDRNIISNCVLIGRGPSTHLDSGVLIRGDGVGDGIAEANQITNNEVSGVGHGIISVSVAPDRASKGTHVTQNRSHDNINGIVVDRAPNCRVRSNEVFNNQVGVYVRSREQTQGTWASAAGTLVSRNLVYGNEVGIQFLSTRNVRADNCNTITGNDIGILVDQDDGNVGVPIIYSNNITGNGTGLLNMVTLQVKAEYNWWGDPGGPGADADGDGIVGDTVIGNVDYTPWLTAPCG